MGRAVLDSPSQWHAVAIDWWLADNLEEIACKFVEMPRLVALATAAVAAAAYAGATTAGFEELARFRLPKR